MRCILEQLSSEDADLPIRAPVVERYKIRTKDAKGRPPEKLDLDESVNAILEILSENPATIIIDALDECDSQRRQDLLLALTKLIRESESLLKIFVSSRDDHDIVHRLSGLPNLYISTHDNQKDIEDYVRLQVRRVIEEERLLCGGVSEDLQTLIVESLISQAQGMSVPHLPKNFKYS
jgi:hypothetical protein